MRREWRETLDHALSLVVHLAGGLAIAYVLAVLVLVRLLEAWS